MGSASLKFNYLRSAPGKKLLMGLTGLVWAGFVLGHMLGNLLLFVGADAYNYYGHLLTSGNMIYLIEAVLIAALLTHVVCAVKLTLENRKARGPHRYAVAATGEKRVSLASRTMAIQGSLILFFIVTHLIGFKFGEVYTTEVDGVPMRDLYRLVVEVFSQPLAVAWYVLALVLLGFHLSHGFGSIFQSLGIKNDRNALFFNKLSWAYALLVTVGFLSQPLYVLVMR